MNSSDLEQIIAPVVQGLGYECWGIEYFSQGKHSMLRIYIDSENGINIDDCVAVSQQLSAVLDVEDPISAQYDLEVSSPGLERGLFKKEHYKKYIGHTIHVRLHRAHEGRRQFTGLLLEVLDETIRLDVSDGPVELPLALINKANLVFNEHEA